MTPGCLGDVLQAIAILCLTACSYYSLQCYRIQRGRVERMEARLKALEERE